ncbi:hypothetical protein [Clostridium baratii]|uniref:hypothetical protein n=1 Tax=Clostridium baratii TaxID=1561 RepID=UPI0030D2C16D
MKERIGTISEYLQIIKEDKEIQKLLEENKLLIESIKKPKRRTAKKEKSKEGIAAKVFLEENWPRLSFILESKYKINSCSNRARGEIKNALMLYFSHKEW